MKTGLKPLGLSTKLVLLGAAVMGLACAAVSVLAYVDQRQNLLEQAQRMQTVTVRVLATDLSSDFEGFSYRLDGDGQITAAVWPEVPAFEDNTLVDHVGAQTSETATVFGWDREQQEFVRRTTNIVRPDGTRAVGTILDPAGAPKAALLRNETFVGRAEILGTPYLTIYVPVTDGAGMVTGALYAGVALSQMDAVLGAAGLRAVLITLGVVLASALGLHLAVRRNLRPLDAVRAAMDRVAEQDFTTPVPGTERQDQIGAIARSLEGFRDRLAAAKAERAERRETDAARAAFFDRLGAGLTALAGGALGTRVHPDAGATLDARTEALAGEFNALAESLGQLIDQTRASATSVQETAAQLAQGSGEMSHRAETQAATLEESAAALDEMTASVKSAADKAAEADG
ncbi:MAG: Cache 3/Cache 2 fusion domain-containing protein, partial [Alkalilacustris sp.]